MECNLSLNDTELRLCLPGSESLPTTVGSRQSKRATASDDTELCENKITSSYASKAQVVGWPPIRSYRRNSFHNDQKKEEEDEENLAKESANLMGMYVKVSMDGAPYLRKIDIIGYKGYPDLFEALEEMFKFTIGEYSEREGYIGSEFVPTYQDKDGDWMLVGDVPWE
ncbi:hypothetical protein V2J09_014261 [Rumex salicifolius]